MAFILDTDIVSILQRPDDPASARLQARLDEHLTQDVFVTVVSLEEQVRGWLAELNRARRSGDLLRAYERILATLEYYCRAQVLPFDRAALDRFDDLRRQRVRIGTLDLRIAAIALARGDTVLSRNLRDFRQVPGLVAEDWTR